MVKQRKQGFCFSCDEKYFRGHRCQGLFFIEVDDYEDDDPSDDTTENTIHTPTVSLHAITSLWRIHANETMQLCVTIGMTDFIVLLDLGSTHNFISDSTVARTGLTLEPHPGFHVEVANDDHVTSGGLCCEMALQVDGEHFKVDDLAIPLRGFDIILGIQWLRSLGSILCDFDNLRMTFRRDGRRITWRGMAAPRTTTRMSTCTNEDLLDTLLCEFEGLFVEPIDLPPMCTLDHWIHPLLGATPVAVHLYRYPHLQKDELE